MNRYRCPKPALVAAVARCRERGLLPPLSEPQLPEAERAAILEAVPNRPGVSKGGAPR